MKVYLCKDGFEDLMTGIYIAWEEALRIGHDQIRVAWEKGYEPRLFEETISVSRDFDKAQKVSRSVQSKISQLAYIWVYRAAMSIEEDAPDTIYQFMRLGFRVGKQVTDMLTEPVVFRLLQISRKVGNEQHQFMEFARFNSLNNQLYISHIEPHHNVAELVAQHFAERMPSENFMIIDDGRKLAAVHPKDGENYLRQLTEEEFERLSTSETYEDDFTSMWRTFFDAIAIKQRENPRCQMTHFPLWARKHVTEFL